MEITQILVIAVLAIAALVGLALLIILALVIKTVAEVFALSKTVHAEIKTLATVVKQTAAKAEGALGVVKRFTKTKGKTKGGA